MVTPPNQPPPPGAPPGWYADPDGVGQRYWDGSTWGSRGPQPGAAAWSSPAPQEKASEIALVLTIVWPGAGHLYLGLTQKAVPYVVANAIGFVLVLLSAPLFFVLVPVAFVIWVVTLCMTVGSVSDDTHMVNDAIRSGQRIGG